MSILLLGSSSQSRQTLLKESNIPYVLIGHTADEDVVQRGATLEETVLAIAQYKMGHVIIPASYEKTTVYILTADTMGCDSAGVIHGKPRDRVDAIEKIKACRDGILTTATGFCIEKRKYQHGAWCTVKHISNVVTAQSFFNVPDNWLDRYLEHSLGLVASGGVAIELYGGQFLREVRGSYSTIVGLPLYEVRESLESIGFFNV